MAERKYTSTFVPAMRLMISMWVGLIVLGVFLDTQSYGAVALTLIICLCGNVLGIPLGMLASPYEKEGSHFQKLGALVATFFSGVVVSQFGEWAAEVDLSRDVDLGRIFLFVAFFVLGAIHTFVFRRYSDETRAKDNITSDLVDTSDAPPPN